jgi:hypothetical protein
MPLWLGHGLLLPICQSFLIFLFSQIECEGLGLRVVLLVALAEFGLKLLIS